MSNKDFVSSETEGGAFVGYRKIKRNLPPTGAGAGRGFVNPGEKDVNGFIHAATNSSPSSTSEYVLDFNPNELDQYDTYTYHWKLFMTSIEDANSGKVLSKNSQVIIAESGVSDLTIDKVELNGIATPSVEAGTGTQTTVKFEVTEPSGAGLIDKMFYESISLGIGNWLVCPYFLQLEFRGRDPETAESDINGASGALGGLRWVWPIKITTVTANVTEIGTRYEFNGILYNEFAQSNSYFVLQQATTLNDLTTFGKAMTELESKINADQYEKLIDNYSIPDVYKIVVDPKIANAAIAKPNDNKNSSRWGDYINFDKRSASFSAGTSIDKVVDALLGNTDYFQKLMQSSRTPASKPDTSITEKDQMKKLWRIITETKPVAFDFLRQTNAVDITIYIVEYDLGVADVNPTQTGQTPESKESEKKRVIEYIQKGILTKKYDYIFTGLNDQIYNLDLKMNFSFAAALARFGGIYYEGSIRDIGVSAKKLDQYKEVTKELRQTLQWLSDPPKGSNVEKKIEETKSAIKNAKLDAKTTETYIKILQNGRPKDRRNFTEVLRTTGGLGGSSLSAARGIAYSLSQPIGTENLKFISDVDIKSNNAKNALDTAKTLARGKLRPIPYLENNQEATTATNVESASNPGRARIANMFSTALYSTLDASLQYIKMTIKGDPFWLYPKSIEPTDSDPRLQYLSNMKESDAIKTIKGTSETNKESVNIFGTDNFIAIRFRTPRIFDETVESQDPYTEIETFSGIYKVTTIVSKFEMGKFTQELNCLLDPNIDLTKVLKEIEEYSKKPNVIKKRTATASTIGPETTNKSNIPTTGSNIPTTSTSLSRSEEIAQTIAGQQII